MESDEKIPMLPVAEAALADLDLFAVVLETAQGSGSDLGGIVLLNDGAGSFSDSGQRLSGKGSSSLALGDLDALVAGKRQAAL